LYSEDGVQMKLFPDTSVFVFLFSFVINIESPVGNSSYNIVVRDFLYNISNTVTLVLFNRV